MKKRKIFKIGIDLDGILGNTHSVWLDWYNKKWKDNLSLDGLTWKIDQIVKPSCGNKIYDFIKKKHIYRKIKPLPGAMEALDLLAQQEHDIVIITHPMGGAHTVPDKQEWLDKYLPKSISRENIIYASRKELVRFDFFIDDSPDNIIRYRDAWPEAKILTIAWPFNVSTGYLVNLRASGYCNTYNAWKQMVKYIEDSDG